MLQVKRQDLGAHFLLVAASLVVVIAGLKAASSLILPLLFSLFLTLVSLPLLNWLRTLKIPKGLAVLLTLCIVIFLLVLVLSLVAGSISGFTQSLPHYQDLLTGKIAGLLERLETMGINVPEEITYDWINPSAALDWVAVALLTVTGVLSNLVMVLLTIAFLLLEAAGFPDKLQAAFGRPENAARVARIRTEVGRYLAIKTSISIVTGVLVTAALWILGVDFPLLWGLLAFLANYIPTLGSIIAAIPPILLALIQLGWGHALAVGILFLLINLVLGNMVEPHLLGRRLGISTLVVFLSLVFWGWVWGPPGMFLSVPLTIILKIMLENTEDFRWIAVLLDSDPKTALQPNSAK